LDRRRKSVVAAAQEDAEGKEEEAEFGVRHDEADRGFSSEDHGRRKEDRKDSCRDDTVLVVVGSHPSIVGLVKEVVGNVRRTRVVAAAHASGKAKGVVKKGKKEAHGDIDSVGQDHSDGCVRSKDQCGRKENREKECRVDTQVVVVGSIMVVVGKRRRIVVVAAETAVVVVGECRSAVVAARSTAEVVVVVVVGKHRSMVVAADASVVGDRGCVVVVAADVASSRVVGNGRRGGVVIVLLVVADFVQGKNQNADCGITHDHGDRSTCRKDHPRGQKGGRHGGGDVGKKEESDGSNKRECHCQMK